MFLRQCGQSPIYWLSELGNVPWGFSFKRKFLPGSGMLEFELVGMEQGTGAGGSAVEGVAHQGVAQGRQLDPDLVSTSGAGMDFEESGGRCGVGEIFQNAVFCFRWAACFCGHFLGGVAGAAHQGSDSAGSRECALNQSPIGFVNSSVSKLAGEIFGSRGGFGDHHNAGGSFIQAVNHTRPVGGGALAGLGPTRGELWPQALD